MAATFSYAQAAKGVSSPATVSKPASGSATPAKDATSKTAPTSVASVGNWADDAETDSATEQPTIANETQEQKPSSKPAVPSQSVDASDASTPDIDALSSSTAAKDDDVSSQPNMSSESTWDNKSQASTSVDKSVEPVEKTSEKTKKAKSAPVKPLKEAPLPAVNVWQQRADEQKTKAKPTPTPATNGTSHGSATKKSHADGNKSAGKGRDDEKTASNRKDGRETEKKGAKGRPSERDVKAAPTALPLPPDRDQESWPTPDTAVDEDRKKTQEKGEKERKDSAPNGASSKQEWVKVPYTPSVVFNTPLPNAAGSRRGGRPGGRGGAQTGGRSAGFATNGAGQTEKDGSASDAMPNGETKRAEGATVGDASPLSKRAGNATSPGSKDQSTSVNGEKSKGPAAAPFEPETQPKRASATTDASQAPNQNGTFPRQYPSKPSKGRRGDFSGPGERRRDGAASPTKDGPEGRSAADGQGENERRAFDGPNGHPSKQNRYSYSGGRERPRGGGRGGRGGFPNGHQFANGHPHSQQSSSSFSLGPRSPTTFNPENSTFFPAPQGKYGRNGHRSQSVADSYRYPPYQSGPPMAPLQTYNMYDYNMVQPMSAVPYNPYGVDQFALFSMITVQVEYYFSVDNLLKDMYLRRHMDSQGFVSLDFIAAFNRIKQLSTDVELLKLVCQQSSHVQYRTGEDGKDRLRRREGWEQWVLNMAERDESAQNEGPKELHNPPIPNPAGFDQANPPQYPVMHAGYGNDISYPQAAEFVPGAPQDGAAAPTESLPNGTTEEAVDGSAVPNGHPVEDSTKAVSDLDSFSDVQLESLTVIVRKQDRSQQRACPPPTSRTFSNGSLDSKSGVTDESEETATCRANDTGPSYGIQSNEKTDSESVQSSPSTVATAPVRLYWVKDQDSPVNSVPSDIMHESYHHLRSKALQQRQNTPLGSTCYDMDVLYQFWSHFLIRNFNTRMYDEFRHFAFEDAAHNMTDVGLSNLIKFYGESLLSHQNVIRNCVARDYVDLVKSEDANCRPALGQLRSALCSERIHPRNRKRIDDWLDDDVLALLEL